MRLNVILHGLVGFVHSPLPQMKAGKASVVKYKSRRWGELYNRDICWLIMVHCLFLCRAKFVLILSCDHSRLHYKTLTTLTLTVRHPNCQCICALSQHSHLHCYVLNIKEHFPFSTWSFCTSVWNSLVVGDFPSALVRLKAFLVVPPNSSLWYHVRCYHCPLDKSYYL